MRTYQTPRPITVRTDANGQPCYMARAGVRDRVRVVNTWIETGAWWDGKPPRTYYKVSSRERVYVAVIFEEQGCWYLHQVMD